MKNMFAVDPTPQYEIAARMINEWWIPCHHVHRFNMANQDGNTAPLSWPGSCQKTIMDNLFIRIAPELRMPLAHIHFLTKDKIASYSRMIEDAGEADGST